MTLDELWVGQRVRLLDSVDGPACRLGTVVALVPQSGGALVRHDLPDFDLDASLSGLLHHDAPGFTFQVWGWMAGELALAEEPS